MTYYRFLKSQAGENPIYVFVSLTNAFFKLLDSPFMMVTQKDETVRDYLQRIKEKIDSPQDEKIADSLKAGDKSLIRYL